MIKITDKDFEQVWFPDGSVKLVYKGTPLNNATKDVQLHWDYFRYVNSAFIMIAQAGKIIKKLTGEKGTLYVKYFPYLRQDKEKLIGEVSFHREAMEFIKYFYKDVICNIPHSNQGKRYIEFNYYDHTEKIVDNRWLKSNDGWLDKIDLDSYDLIVYPDSSARERILDNTRSGLNSFRNIEINKARNAETGELTFSPLVRKQKRKIKRSDRILIIDDICSKGGTFIAVNQMIEEVNPTAKIDLFVNVYENSAGYDFKYKFNKVMYNLNLKTGESKYE